MFPSYIPKPGLLSFDTYDRAAASLAAGIVDVATVRTHRGIVGTWSLDGGDVSPCGWVDFSKCVVSQTGQVDSADIVAGTVTLLAGHTFTATSGVLRIWNRTTAEEGGDVAYTRSGLVLTVGVAAAVVVANALGVPHVVDLRDTRETISVGGATRGLTPAALSTLGVVTAGLGLTGTVTPRITAKPMPEQVVAHIASWTAFTADDQRLAVGFSGVQYLDMGVRQVPAVGARVYQDEDGAISASPTVGVGPGGLYRIGMTLGGRAGAFYRITAQIGDSSSVTTRIATWSAATNPTWGARLVADAGAVISRLEL